MNTAVVTTSWDDGSVLDIRLAELLKRENLSGTFYIAPENRELPPSGRLSKEDVRVLANDFEIGAHTMTHPRLTSITDDGALREIQMSKTTLEAWSQKTVTSFCYPGGAYNEKHKRMVKDSGFLLARTVRRFSMDIPLDRFALPTTLHAYRHWSDIVPIAQASGRQFLKNYLNWDDLAITIFDRVLERGGTFHLWGHSWEIEKNHDWERLERVFKHIARRPGVRYVANNQLA
jgi:peptidoglycan/xylan/chitin deacetylase (PgdA/CDA1 family)